MIKKIDTRTLLYLIKNGEKQAPFVEPADQKNIITKCTFPWEACLVKRTSEQDYSESSSDKAVLDRLYIIVIYKNIEKEQRGNYYYKYCCDNLIYFKITKIEIWICDAIDSKTNFRELL